MAVAYFHVFAMANGRCEEVLKTTPGVFLGTMIDPPLEVKVFAPEGRFFALGRGGGGQVFRVIQPDGETFVLKLYSQPHGLFQDAAALNLLAEITTLDQFKIRVPGQIVTLSDRVLRLEDVRGRTLKEVISDSNVAVSVKAQLLNRYNTFLEKFAIEFETIRLNQFPLEFEREENTPSRLYGIYKFPNGTHTFWFKSDNIIVQSETHDLVIIDPL